MKKQVYLARKALSIKRLGLAAGLAFFSTGAMAYTAPAVGDLGYSMFDVFVNQGLKGAPGFVAAAIFVAFGFGSLFRSQILLGVFGLLAATALFNADTVVTSLGFVV